MIKLVTSPSFIILIPIVAILSAPGTGSTVARLAASAVVLLAAKMIGIDVDLAAWVSNLTW